MIIIGTDDGLFAWRPEEATLMRLGTDCGRVTSVAVTGTGRFFAVCGNARVIAGDVNSAEVAELNDGLEGVARCVATQGDGVYVGTVPAAVYRYDTAFKRWESLGDLRGMPFAANWTSHTGDPVVRTLAPHPNIPGALYADIHVGGIVRTLDGGLTWESISAGLDPDVHQVTTTPARPDNVYAATADGFYRSRTEGDRWDRMNEGLENLYCRAVTVHPTCPEVILLGCAPVSPAEWDEQNKRFAVFRSDDSGKTWRRVIHGLPAEMPAEVDSFFIAFSVHFPDRAFCARRDGILYQSLDMGMTWDEVANGLPRINALAAM
ncbi:MAG: hypothetical protein RBU21_05400 [FCB group bacterium]|jgi:hypothetical protein|nr:hypothetical protein [FCB group bacterium]